jgi:recombination protein RecT
MNEKNGKTEALSTVLASEQKGLTVYDYIVKAEKALTDTLPRGMDAQRMMRIAKSCVSLTPGLAEVAPYTFLGALMTAAQLGLEPIAGRAWILPFWNNKRKRKEAQFVIGYKGVVDLFYRHPRGLLLTWGIVKEGDHFSYEYGTNAFLRHLPADLSADDQPSPVLYYWVLAKLAGGVEGFYVMTREQCIEHGKKHSKTFDEKKGEFIPESPWLTDQDAMCLKTVWGQLSKTMPLSFEMQRALAQDETSREYTGEIKEPLDIQPTKWEDGEAIDAEVDEEPIEMHSDLHKVVEAKIGESSVDRERFKAYIGLLGFIKEVDGRWSVSTLTRNKAEQLLNGWEDIIAGFIEHEEKAQD